METSTPRIRRDYGPLKKWLQVVVRQRAPDTNNSVMCAANFITVHGRPYYFDRVFGPREKNQTLLEFHAPALDEFVNGRNACIIGFGEANTGVSWTLGTNPSSNGLVPGIYRYLKDRGIKFRIKAQLIADSLPRTRQRCRQPFTGHEESYTWRQAGDRYELKRLLKDFQPPEGSLLVFWFSLADLPATKLAVVDLPCMPKSLVNNILRHAGRGG